MRKRFSTVFKMNTDLKNYAITNYQLEEGRKSLFMQASVREVVKRDSVLEQLSVPRNSEGAYIQPRKFTNNPFKSSQ